MAEPIRVEHRKGKDDWETPMELFCMLDLEFFFQLDAAASHENAKCLFYCTKDGLYMEDSESPYRISRDNGLEADWSPYKTVWLNPPYSQWQKWVKKAVEEQARGVTTVMLLPARTDTRAFHEYILPNVNTEIRYVKGRIRFVGAEHGAPFPSMVVIFNGQG